MVVVFWTSLYALPKNKHLYNKIFIFQTFFQLFFRGIFSFGLFLISNGLFTCWTVQFLEFIFSSEVHIKTKGDTHQLLHYFSMFISLFNGKSKFTCVCRIDLKHHSASQSLFCGRLDSPCAQTKSTYSSIPTTQILN